MTGSFLERLRVQAVALGLAGRRRGASVRRNRHRALAWLEGLEERVVMSNTPVGYLIQGNAGSYQVPLNGATSFTAASVTQGTLPAGLSLSNSGLISGTPAAGTTGTYSLTLNVTPSGGSAYSQDLTLGVLANQFVDPDYSANDGFGSSVVVLSGGNVVVTAPQDDAAGTDAGAVYLFNGSTGALISTLTGSSANDKVGSGGVKALSNGNYVVVSSSWSSSMGAVTWGNGTSGISGVVSSSNSLVGSTATDGIGNPGVLVLSSGNYLVLSSGWSAGSGAATWGSGTAGVRGVVSSSNSLVGSAGDAVCSSVEELTNGNYVVRSINWSSTKGAVTWASGTAGVSGVVSSSNSLVGSSANDYVGTGVTVLTNGNYVVDSYSWSSVTGAVTWGSGTAGVHGVVSSSNSLVGSSPNDRVGQSNTGAVALTNGNYVVRSPWWSSNTGAATWGSGTAGVSGVVSSSNSLVGSAANEGVGGIVVALTNGNYVVNSYSWSSNKGAVTWGSGTAGVSGVISSSNSLVGSAAYDQVGNANGLGVTALSNGNYVVNSPYWSSSEGAVTWGSGTAGVSGVVSSSNSLVGSTANDKVGGASNSVTALTNGNYVVNSPSWSSSMGAVTWGSGTAGVSGVVSSSNSLVGSTASDLVGSIGVTALTNGNYVVRSSWSSNKGAVTWGSGTAGVSGVVSSSNSLVGSTANDKVGFNGVTALTNGNYVVRSASWSSSMGAATWGSGTAGVNGVVSSSNSLVGSSANDKVSNTAVTELSNGNYFVSSSSWSSSAGAVTLGSGPAGVSGVVSGLNSLVGPFQSITPTKNTVANTFMLAMKSPAVIASTSIFVPTTTTLASSASPSTYGGSVTFTATVTSGATGTVTFKDGSSTLGTGTISGTTATFSTAALTAGSHSITAVYGGDTNYATSTSSAVTQTVNQASSTTSVASGLNPSTYGGSVTFTATVTSGATGTVSFMEGTSTLGTGTISGTTATFSTSALTGGSHSITAVYGGDSNFTGSTSSAVSQTVNQASTTTSVASGLNPSIYGGSVTFTATVTSGATGTVTFKDGSNTLGTGTISGTTATFSTAALTGGSHSITAVYGGNSNYAGSTSSAVTQTVNKASTTTSVASGLTPSTYGGSVTFTATVTSGATGTVSFMEGSSTLGTGTISGTTATFSISSLSAGSHSITAVYGGDTNYATSTSSAVTQTVNQASSTTSVASGLNPSTFGGSVTFTATVPSGATGTVSFMEGTTTLGTGTISGTTATFSTVALTAGSHSITALYGGDSNFIGSTSSAVTQTVNKASTTTSVASGLTPSTFGGSVTFTATVTSGATGTVSFMEGTTTLGTGTISGTTATFSTAALTGGSHSITAVYGGNSNYAGSTSSAVTQTVNKASTTTSVASSANPATLGDSVTFTATVTSGATGSVTFYDGTTSLGTVSLSGTDATLSTSALSAGSHSITAVYVGDSNYATSTSVAVNQVMAAAPLVTSNPTGQTVNAGATATFTAVAIGNPVPSVQWQVSTNGGSSWANISGATSATYSFTAAAGNDSNQYRALFINNLGSAASSSATLRVNQAPAVSSQPLNVTTNTGTMATFTAAATGSPTPSVQWQVSTNSGSTWSNISGAIGTSYSTLASGNSGSQFRAVFTNTFGIATTNAATLTIGVVATVSSTSVGWGTQTANLYDAGNGRLLPQDPSTGNIRVNDIPWLGINKITLTLNQSIASLTAGNITIRSAGGFTYSVSSVTGSGTSWTINLGGSGLANADKVTVAVNSSSVASYSKRLDVLPGDANDDGLVSSLDQLLVSRQLTGAYIVFYDIDGTGTLTTNDATLIKARIGAKLPA